MEKTFRIRDPVHNFVELKKAERDLVGTRLFQRLRGIRQLAMANLVYPGSLHTRFDHSMGVCHVAGRMASALNLNSAEDEINDVRLAALLHDVGHGPFSHVSEYSLEMYADKKSIPEGTKKAKIHELVTAKLLENDSEIQKCIGSNAVQRVLRLLEGNGGSTVMQRIISGPLDADKQDYLLRDSRYCGVPYGVFDLEQLHRSFRIGGARGADLAIREGGLHAVEQFALAKYYMTANVYRHKVRLITDQMLVRAVKLGIEIDNNKILRQLYTYDGSDAFLNNYQKWDDSRFLCTFSNNNDVQGLCADIVDRLQSRRLLRRIFHSRIREFDAESRDLLAKISNVEKSALRTKIESDLASVVSTLTSNVDKRLVIVHGYKIPSVRGSVKNDTEGIMVHEASGRILPFDEVSSLFRSIDSTVDDQFVDVYAPVEWGSHVERDKFITSVHKPVFDVLDAKARPSLFGESP